VIPNSQSGFNKALFVEHIELYPHLELVVTDKHGVVFYQTPPTESYTNNWEGKDQNLNPLPEGIYNYILRIRQKDQCIRIGVLGINYDN
jgi:hypothetical protein